MFWCAERVAEVPWQSFCIVDNLVIWVSTCKGMCASRCNLPVWEKGFRTQYGLWRILYFKFKEWERLIYLLISFFPVYAQNLIVSPLVSAMVDGLGSCRRWQARLVTSETNTPRGLPRSSARVEQPEWRGILFTPSASTCVIVPGLHRKLLNRWLCYQKWFRVSESSRVIQGNSSGVWRLSRSGLKLCLDLSM